MITIKYGAGNKLERDQNGYQLVGDILDDENLQVSLGFGNNVEAVINGTIVGADAEISDGDEIVLVTKANKKG